MKIKKVIHKCNDIIFVSKCIYMGKRKNKHRRRRFKSTPEQQKERNRRLAERKLLVLLHNNFDCNGLHLVLSYDNEPVNITKAKNEIENFIRRLRYTYKKFGTELKYIQVTEYRNKRLHHHMIINGIEEISPAKIQNNIWKNGFVRNTPLKKEECHNKLAAYLIKETSKTFNTNERVFGKRYTSSRNLQLPEPQEEIQQGTEKEVINIPLIDTFEGKEYELIKGSEYIGINDYTGLTYAEYAMKKTTFYKKPRPGGGSIKSQSITKIKRTDT